MPIGELVEILRRDWATPRRVEHRGEPCPFPLACSFTSPAVELGGLKEREREIPKELIELWQSTESARLFEDTQFGQWGLELLSPTRAAETTRSELTKRPRDYSQGDLIIGRFIGDSDLLLIRSDPEHSDFGSILVSVPLDRRTDWDRVAPNLEEFLRHLIAANGDKYWEVR